MPDEYVPDPALESGRFREALVEAVRVIRNWHGLHLGTQGEPVERSLWGIYWRNSPELASIRDALGHEDPTTPKGEVH